MNRRAIQIRHLALVAGLSGCSALYSDGDNGGNGTPITPTSCPDRFALRDDSYCYREFGTSDFATQVGRCSSVRYEGVAAHPAVIENAAERAALGAFLSSVSEGDAWIGLYDSDENGDGEPDDAWYWITGRDFVPAITTVMLGSNEAHAKGLCARITFQSNIVRRDCLVAPDNLICEWDGLVGDRAYPHGVE